MFAGWSRAIKARPAPARDARQAGRRRDQRRRARRRPRDRARLPPPDRRRRPEGRSSASPRSRSACCPAAAASPASCGCSASQNALHGACCCQGTRFKPGAGQGDRPGRRAASPRATSWCPPPRRGSRPTPTAHAQPWDAKGYKMPGGTPSQPGARGDPAGVPGAACASSSRARDYPAPRAILAAAVEGAQVDFDTAQPDRGPLLRRPGHRPGREEHDPGVLLRPAGDQRRRAAGPRASSRSRPRRSACSAPG